MVDIYVAGCGSLSILRVSASEDRRKLDEWCGPEFQSLSHVTPTLNPPMAFTLATWGRKSSDEN
eukprot:2283606-Amphidinium_carterae.1